MRYEHDCEHCTPLGEHGEYDLYFCKQGGYLPTVIARFGTESDYLSGLEFVDQVPALKEAKDRSVNAGLLPDEGPQ